MICDRRLRLIAHLSWYQLTIEPNTLFGSRPPVLPDDDALWDIFEQGPPVINRRGLSSSLKRRPMPNPVISASII